MKTTNLWVVYRREGGRFFGVHTLTSKRAAVKWVSAQREQFPGVDYEIVPRSVLTKAA